MGLLDRVLLTLYTFALMVFAALALVVALGYQPAFEAFRVALLSPQGRWATGVGSLLVLVASVRLLYSAFALPRAQVVHETAFGEVRITREAVDHLLQRVGRQVRGVRDVRPHVTIGPDGVRARLRIWVSPEVHIPSLAAQVQDELRRAVRDVVGVELVDLAVRVENIGTDVRRGRVE